MKLAPNENEAEVLKNLSQSWLRLAGQIDRYQALMREQRCIVQNNAASVGGVTSGPCGPVPAQARRIGRFGLKALTS